MYLLNIGKHLRLCMLYYHYFKYLNIVLIFILFRDNATQDQLKCIDPTSSCNFLKFYVKLGADC